MKIRSIALITIATVVSIFGCDPKKEAADAAVVETSDAAVVAVDSIASDAETSVSSVETQVTPSVSASTSASASMTPVKPDNPKEKGDASKNK